MMNILKAFAISGLLLCSGSALADAMCGPNGQFNPNDNQCWPIQGGGGNSTYDYRHGAIVHQTGTDYFYSRVRGHSSSSVINEATGDCRNGGGTSDSCTLVAVFYNQCAAVALGPKYYSINYDNTIGDAKMRALRSCTGTDKHACQIVLTTCSD